MSPFCFLLKRRSWENEKEKYFCICNVKIFCLSWNFKNLVWIKLKTCHEVEKVPITLYLLSLTLRFFPESQFGDRKSALCWKMPFSRSLLPDKQGPNVWGKSLITSGKAHVKISLQASSLGPTLCSKHRWEGRISGDILQVDSLWELFPSASPEHYWCLDTNAREEWQTSWGAHKGSFLWTEFTGYGRASPLMTQMLNSKHSHSLLIR